MHPERIGGSPGFFLPLLLVALVVCNGCIVIPVPHEEAPVAASRQMISAAELSFIQPGVTRRDQVILRLGAPDLSLDHDRVLIYGWTSSDFALLWLLAAGSPGRGGAGGAAGGVIEFVAHSYLLLEFDPAGRVRRIEIYHAPKGSPGGDFLRQVAKAW